MRIQYTPAFNRMYRKLQQEQKGSVDVAMDLFRTDPFHPNLRNHKLQGSKKGLRSFSAGHDLRILYAERGGHALVLMLKVGSHDVVY